MQGELARAIESHCWQHLPKHQLDRLIACSGSCDFDLRLSTQGSVRIGVAVTDVILP
jgi:hypothetical protein